LENIKLKEMIEIKKIYKKDIPSLFINKDFWNHSFLSISKHRLLAHYNNSVCKDDDIVLLLAYLNDELVGYMGVYMDNIILDSVEHKVGWLSTWWVHPKTQGSGIGKQILNTMYNLNDGKIGISQFTPSARRVYDKSGYFVNLKENIGIKAVLKSNLSYLLPMKFPKLKALKSPLSIIDYLLNSIISIKLFYFKFKLKSKLKNITIEYLNKIDDETLLLINKNNKNHLSNKTPVFFEWLKSFHWVQEAPLIELTNKNKYEFSIYDKSFNFYLIKIIENNECIGFIVLQRRNVTIKVLFSYYSDVTTASTISDIIKLHCIHQQIHTVICYDINICKNLNNSNVFIYKREKIKQSILSKKYNKTNFDEIIMNYGDGDCSFA
jgi:hypothetical protein